MSHREVDTKLRHARDSVRATELLIESGLFRDSASRSYYAMFSAAQALLIAHDLTPKTYKGTHVLLDKHFTKADFLPAWMSQSLRRGFDARQLADYSDQPIRQEAATELLEDASAFVEAIERFLAE